MTATANPLTRAQRLDRLPFTREHGRLVVGSGLGWALDAMDVGLISVPRWVACSPTASAGARSSPSRC
jgi:hypothetical protein